MSPYRSFVLIMLVQFVQCMLALCLCGFVQQHGTFHLCLQTMLGCLEVCTRQQAALYTNCRLPCGSNRSVFLVARLASCYQLDVRTTLCCCGLAGYHETQAGCRQCSQHNARVRQSAVARRLLAIIVCMCRCLGLDMCHTCGSKNISTSPEKHKCTLCW
jgi:hypothetical protein